MELATGEKPQCVLPSAEMWIWPSDSLKQKRSRSRVWTAHCMPGTC